MSSRYAQCDDTCTTDCGHCKGAGRPTEPTGDLRERAAVLLYPGLFPDDAYRLHPVQIDRVAAFVRDALAAQEKLRRVEALIAEDAWHYDGEIRRALAGDS
jgi:hypothetical protein